MRLRTVQRHVCNIGTLNVKIEKKQKIRLKKQKYFSLCIRMIKHMVLLNFFLASQLMNI